MPISPADVVAASLRRAGVPQPDTTAQAVVADLAGHGLLYEAGKTTRAKKTSAPAPKCRNPAGAHWMTDLVGDTCPICGWSPNT